MRPLLCYHCCQSAGDIRNFPNKWPTGGYMPYILKSEDALGCIFIRWRGTFSYEEGAAHYREVAEFESFQQGSHLFHDVRLVNVDVPASEIQSVAKAASPKATAKTVRKVAILTSSDLGFGIRCDGVID